MSDLVVNESRHADAIRDFLVAAMIGDGLGLQCSLATLSEVGAVVDGFRHLVDVGWRHPDPVHPEAKQAFADAWIGEGRPRVAGAPGGRHLRNIFADNLELFVAGLRLLIPPLQGKAPTVIYRGQSLAERERGVVGFSWSPNPMLAEVYARHKTMNSGPCVVIAKFFPGDAIIGQISKLEFILDPTQVGATQAIYTPKQKLSDEEAQNLGRATLDLTVLYDLAQEYPITH